MRRERRHIGCMTGFIHLFDPNQTTFPKRITNSMTIRALQDDSQYFRGSGGVEQTADPYLQHGLEMRSNKNSNDKIGMYTESSRASCSSSPSSSFSSLDYSKVMNPEASSNDRIIFPESPLLDRSLSHSSSSWRMRQRSFDLDETVNDFPCTIEEESMLLKHQDSSRQLQPLKHSIGYINLLGTSKAPHKFKDSVCFEDRYPSRPWDELKSNQYERTELGCYRRETKERQENCSTSDDVARLSLDSSTECYVPNSKRSMHHHIQRPPSIVEKLMGLEAMPGVNSFTMQNSNRFVKICEKQNTTMISKSVSPASACTPIQVSNTQRFLKKHNQVHKWKNGELVTKPISSSRILIEPAPWKQPAVKSKQGSACESNGFTDLYSKFEGRLNDMEFQRSSKDLKALKQMLDSVQQNGSGQVERKILSNGMTMNQNPDLDMTSHAAKWPVHQNACVSVANDKQERCAKTLKSPIVVMKPFRLVANSDIAASSVIRSDCMRHLLKPQGSDSAPAVSRQAFFNTQKVKGQIPQHGYQSPRISQGDKKLTHKPPTMTHPLVKEKKLNSSVSAGSASPRMQQKKFELEKKRRTATASSDAIKLSMSKSKHPRKSCSPTEKTPLKYSFDQQCNAQQSGFSTESKDTYCGDETEVTSKLRLDHVDGSRSPARNVARPMLCSIRKHKPSQISSKDTLLAHPATVVAEQPSPVSVLDSLTCRSDPPSPSIRKIASCQTAEVVTHMSREKLKQIDDLVHKLNGVGSTYDETNKDFIASLYKISNPDQRYISKILLASGFLFRDFESKGSTFQPHISGNPINPELFLVLEQTKSSALLSEDLKKNSASKSHRRLIFDSCNEILSELLIPSGITNNSQSMHRKIARRKITARRLLKDTCDQIEQLQAKSIHNLKVEQEEGHNEDDDLQKIVHEDMMLKLDKWGNSEKCIPEVVLDIERMLFKDLVKEIVNDEAVSCALRVKGGGSWKV